MPCTDWDDAKPISASEYVSMERRAHELEAMLCAVFTELEKIAIVQSVKSSNAIEGIITSDERIKEIVNQKV